MFAIVFLQILHVDWVEAGRVFSVVYVLAEGWEPIGFICMSSIALSIDEIACILLKKVTIPRGAGVMTLVLESRLVLTARVVVFIRFLVVMLSCWSTTVMGSGWSWILPTNLMQGISGQALDLANFRGVRQALH